MGDSRDWQNELFRCLRNDDIDGVLRAIANGAQVNDSNRMHKSALFLAFNYGYHAIATCLLERHADPDLESYYGHECAWESPLVTVARLGQSNNAKLLLEQGAKLQKANHHNSMSALMWAAKRGDLELASLLLDYGADVNDRGPASNTALNFAAMEKRLDVVRWLLLNGANDIMNTDGRSALHLAASIGDQLMCQILMKDEFFPNVLDKFNFSPFGLACLRGHLPIVLDMLEKSDVDVEEGLIRAGECGHVDIVSRLCGLACLDATNERGETALSVAARAHPITVLTLIKAGACLNLRDKRGCSPLQHAAIRQQIDTSIMLVRHGAFLEPVTLPEGPIIEAPLDLAISLNSPLLLKLLLEAGVNLVGKRETLRDRIQLNLNELDFRCRENLQRNKEIWKWLLRRFVKPYTLKQASRICIRRCLCHHASGCTILPFILRLSMLPVILQQYLSMEDVTEVG